MMVGPTRQPTNTARPRKNTSGALPWRKILIVTFILIGLAGVSIVVYPFIPIVQYSLGLIHERYPYVSRLDVNHTAGNNVQPIPQENRLVIPKIGVDAEIVEGTNADIALEKGIWHIPDTSMNPEEGNMVLSAHRFRYLPPSNRTFYLLDKLEPNDSIIIYWEGEEYDYTVTDETIVEPSQVEILDPTETPRLTLYTCSPLFSTDKRLVIFAEPMADQSAQNG